MKKKLLSVVCPTRQLKVTYGSSREPAPHECARQYSTNKYTVYLVKTLFGYTTASGGKLQYLAVCYRSMLLVYSTEEKGAKGQINLHGSKSAIGISIRKVLI